MSSSTSTEKKPTSFDKTRTSFKTRIDEKEVLATLSHSFEILFMGDDEDSMNMKDWEKKLLKHAAASSNGIIRKKLKLQFDNLSNEGATNCPREVFTVLMNHLQAADMFLKSITNSLLSFKDKEVEIYVPEIVRLHNARIQSFKEGSSDPIVQVQMAWQS